MADLDENPAPKLRLLKRRLQKNDPTSYDYAGKQTNRPRARNAPVTPPWNSDIEVQQADNVGTTCDKPTVPVAPCSGRQRPLPKKASPMPEWNSETMVSPEESGHDSVPSSQPQVPQARRQSGQLKARSGSFGGSSHTSVLESEASLSDSVPKKWSPAFHHAAELLTSVGCATVGSFRRFVKEIPVNKIVDATLAADASCASPGCIRDRMEAQKIIEEFIRLVRDDLSDAPIRKTNPKSTLVSHEVAASTSHGYAAAQHKNTDTNTTLLVRTSPISSAAAIVNAGTVGCPKCGRDVSGRALVMHLKTCHLNVSQAKQADPFTEERNSPSQNSVVPTHQASLQKPASSPMSVPQSKHPGSQMMEVARVTSPRMEKTPSIPQQLFEPDAFTDEPQLPCPHCGRTFREKILQRHVGTCLKINKERKKFNALSQALPSEAVKIHKEIEKFESKQKKKPTNSDASKPSGQMPAWKAKSEAFRNAIKGARVVDQCIKEGAPLPAFVPTAPELDDRTQCPHCGRKFGQLQAERHIPVCPKGKGKGKGKR